MYPKKIFFTNITTDFITNQNFDTHRSSGTTVYIWNMVAFIAMPVLVKIEISSHGGFKKIQCSRL